VCERERDEVEGGDKLCGSERMLVMPVSIKSKRNSDEILEQRCTTPVHGWRLVLILES
jgi:hypothetical protein